MSAAAAHWWRDGGWRRGRWHLQLLGRGLFLVVSSPIFGGWEKGIETSVGNTWTVDIKSIVGGQDCRAKGPM